LERQLQAGEIFLEQQDFDHAEKLYSKLHDNFPGDHRIYWGIIRYTTKNFTYFPDYAYHNDPVDSFKTFLKSLQQHFEKMERFAGTQIAQYRPAWEDYLRKGNAHIAQLERREEQLKLAAEAWKQEQLKIRQEMQETKARREEELRIVSDRYFRERDAREKKTKEPGCVAFFLFELILPALICCVVVFLSWMLLASANILLRSLFSIGMAALTWFVIWKIQEARRDKYRQEYDAWRFNEDPEAAQLSRQIHILHERLDPDWISAMELQKLEEAKRNYEQTCRRIRSGKP
jgi:hypothetical protein